MVFMVFIGFSNVFGFQNTQTLEKPINMTHKEPKTLEKPIKTIKTMIFKLSPGATPPSGDSLKIMVFMVFIGFSKVFGFQNTETLEKPIKSARREPKTLEKPIKVTHKEPKTLEKTNKNDTQGAQNIGKNNKNDAQGAQNIGKTKPCIFNLRIQYPSIQLQYRSRLKIKDPLEGTTLQTPEGPDVLYVP